MKHRILGVVTALFLAVAAAPSPAATLVTAVATSSDAAAEITAALYNASATQSALARTYDVELRAEQAHIASMTREVRAGRRQIAELAAAQNRLVAALAERDHAYALAIAVFRNSVTDIASTPEGAQALEKYNSGQEVEALEILDRLRAADHNAMAAADRARENFTSAEQARRIAMLAYESYLRQKIDISNIIDRYEEIVALDPRNYHDWIILADLYFGDNDKVLFALHSAVNNATTQCDKIDAWMEVALQLSLIGNRDDEEVIRNDILKYHLEELKKYPNDRDKVYAYTHAVSGLVDNLVEDGNYLDAIKRQNEIISDDTHVFVLEKSSYSRRNIAFDWERLGYIAYLSHDTDLAIVSYRRALPLFEALTKESPEDIGYQINGTRNDPNSGWAATEHAQLDKGYVLNFGFSSCSFVSSKYNPDSLKTRYENYVDVLTKYARVLREAHRDSEYHLVDARILIVSQVLAAMPNEHRQIEGAAKP
ncbi:hypothetical protein GCM10009087_40380 [Sphingomonas oligophenolica]|uniref:Tetratricopeptide repeat protein n=1 Tax=Sphingomonas oligophenolica TaxID=301154 RepID=A0ABU9Y222_9SPHN